MDGGRWQGLPTGTLGGGSIEEGEMFAAVVQFDIFFFSRSDSGMLMLP